LRVKYNHAKHGAFMAAKRVGHPPVDAIGRLCAVATSVNTTCGASSGPFATGFGYSTANQVTTLEYGNSIYASFGFSSDRLQLNCLDYSTTNRSGTGCAHDGTTKFGLTYSYGTAGSNNGQISSIMDYMDNGRTITYTYDSLYRMTKAVMNGSSNYPAWGLSETYDRYGNRSAQSIASGCTGITCPTNSVTVSATTNQITGSPYAYDASGDMTDDGVNTLTYDGEGRAVTASGSLGSGTYTVDGNGLRVKKVAGSTTTVYIFSGSKVIAEYQNGAAPSAPTTEYVYAGGTLIAKINSSGTNFYHQDHLSNRYVTNSSGGMVAQLGHFPFGESWYNATSDKLYFTSYEYDSESGNHYALARYHVSRLGRLSSPDPLPGSTGNPQSLNRYSYSTNDPANLADPSGAIPTGCYTTQAKPMDKSQQPPGTGHSDTDALDANSHAGDLEAAPPKQTGCGLSGDASEGGGGGGLSLDGGFVSDDSGQLPGGGFPVGGGDVASQIALMNVPENPTHLSEQQTLVGDPGILFFPFIFQDNGGDGGQGGGGNPLCGVINCGPRNPPPPPGYEKCITEALETVIAAGEVPGQPDGGYGTAAMGTVVSAPQPFQIYVGMTNVHLGGGYLSQLTGNPGLKVKWAGGYSTAFGRYQINQPTAAQFNVTDWTPAGQDAAGATIMNSQGMVAAAMQGGFAGFQQAMWDGNTRWASLPDSPYGQPTMTMQGAYQTYQNALATLPDCQ
jgi:RHS repeat-associated protein